MRASIIIRTLNEGRHLPAVLQAVRQQTVGCDDRETIIVDSGSTDETLQIAAGEDCKILHISHEEFSFGRSLNLGCGSAHGNILVFVSGHCIPSGVEWLERLILPIEKGDAQITYGRQIGGATTRFSEHQVFAKYFPERGVFEDVPFFCNNANAALAKGLWQKLLFAENLTGLEDMDFAKRAYEAFRARVQYVPDAVVYHYHAETWRQVKRRFEREAYALQHIMPELHFTTIDAIRCFWSGVRVDLREMQLGLVKPNVIKEVLLFRFCQFYGAWKGHHTHRELSKKRKQRYFYPAER
jgi:glycosyltransferase involved in cell wall biosynthesis